MDPEPEQQASTGGGASTPPPQPAQGPGPSEGVDSGTGPRAELGGSSLVACGDVLGQGNQALDWPL